MKTKKILIAFVGLSVFAASCSQRSVTRINPDEQTDVSGRWNDSDNKIVADDMIDQMIDQTWRTEFQALQSKKPVVIVGSVRNKTSEFIDPVAIIKEIERAFVNSGKVRVVATAEERKEMREEREDQQIFASEESKKKWGKEKGADFMLNGTLYSVTDQYKNEKIVAYQVDFELTNLETNEKVWLGQSRIKKQIKN